MGIAELVSVVVGDTTDEHALAVVFQHFVFIEQHAQPKTAAFVQPGVDAVVVLVIAGDVIAAVPRTQLRQRRDMTAQPIDVAVDDVAGQRNQIGIESVDAPDDRIEIAALDRRSDMNVAELDDDEAGQRGGQPGDRQLDINDPGEAARVPEADEAEQRGEGDYRERRVASHGIEGEGDRPSPFRGDPHDETSEERRVGKERVSTFRSRWSQYHYKQKPKETE